MLPDIIGEDGPIDEPLVKRIEAARTIADRAREAGGRPWLKARPLAANGTSPQLRIAVISLNGRRSPRRRVNQTEADRLPQWQHPLSSHNKLQYCKRWGYDLIIEDNSIVHGFREVAWSKVLCLKKWLPHYDYVMWVDMDTMFMRFDIPIEALITGRAKDLFITKDWNGLNTGVFILKNSDFAFSLLADMWRVPRRLWEPWHEQSALMALLNPRVLGSPARSREAHIEYLGQRDMNSYPQHFAAKHHASQYQVEDPIAHFPNCKGIPQCRRVIERFYQVACKVNRFEPLGRDTVMPMRIAPAGVVDAPRSALRQHQ